MAEDQSKSPRVDRREDEGKVSSVHLTEVITDPDSDLAVQVPSTEEAPTVNATGLDPLAVHEQPSPNEVAELSEKKQEEAENVQEVVPGEVVGDEDADKE